MASEEKSELREHLRNISPDSASIVDDLWRRSRPIHEKQNTNNSNTENGTIHVATVEKGIWRFLNCPTLPHKADFLNNPYFILVLSAAACCHDFGKATDTPGFQHGEDSAEFIQQNEDKFGLKKHLRLDIQSLIRVHNDNCGDFYNTVKAYKTDHAFPGGEINIRLGAVLLKASDILHCDNTRIMSINHCCPVRSQINSTG